MPWFFPPSSMVVRRGHWIAGISRNWSSSSCELSAPSWESGGGTTLPIWRSSIKLSPPALRPPSSRPNFDGLDTWFEWRSVWCQDAWCTGNSRSAKETKYKDTVKVNLQWCHINPRDLEGYAVDRPKWRGSVHKAAANFEEARCQKLTAARERQRRVASAVISTTNFECPHCSRLCASGLGLRSYLHFHEL